MSYSTRDTEFDRIYVNGDNNMENLRTDGEQWKVVLTEQEFAKRMFEELLKPEDASCHEDKDKQDNRRLKAS